MFVSPAYSRGFIRMHDTCAHCGLNFHIETGFYWGSMYFTYAYTTAIFVATFVGTHIMLSKPSVWLVLGLTLGFILTLYPLLIRYGRVAMLHVFGGVQFEREKFDALPKST